MITIVEMYSSNLYALYFIGTIHTAHFFLNFNPAFCISTVKSLYLKLGDIFCFFFLKNWKKHAKAESLAVIAKFRFSSGSLYVVTLILMRSSVFIYCRIICMAGKMKCNQNSENEDFNDGNSSEDTVSNDDNSNETDSNADNRSENTGFNDDRSSEDTDSNDDISRERNIEDELKDAVLSGSPGREVFSLTYQTKADKMNDEERYFNDEKEGKQSGIPSYSWKWYHDELLKECTFYSLPVYRLECSNRFNKSLQALSINKFAILCAGVNIYLYTELSFGVVTAQNIADAIMIVMYTGLYQKYPIHHGEDPLFMGMCWPHDLNLKIANWDEILAKFNEKIIMTSKRFCKKKYCSAIIQKYLVKELTKQNKLLKMECIGVIRYIRRVVNYLAGGNFNQMVNLNLQLVIRALLYLIFDDWQLSEDWEKDLGCTNFSVDFIIDKSRVNHFRYEMRKYLPTIAFTYYKLLKIDHKFVVTEKVRSSIELFLSKCASLICPMICDLKLLRALRDTTFHSRTLYARSAALKSQLDVLYTANILYDLNNVTKIGESAKKYGFQMSQNATAQYFEVSYLLNEQFCGCLLPEKNTELRAFLNGFCGPAANYMCLTINSRYESFQQFFDEGIRVSV